MGVFANGGINFSAISAEMRGTVENWFNATIQIIDPNVGDVEWDVYTNTQSSGTPTVLWSGKARVQHLSQNRTPDVAYSQTDIRGIRIQLPYDAELGLIRKGLQVVVTDGGSDPVLEQLGFVVRASVNSSYAWNRTIECDVDLKSVADSTWSGVAGHVEDVDGNPMADVAVRTFHYADGVWLLDYETTTDVYGNYELPADAGVQIIVGAFKSGYFTQYWEGSDVTSTATTITPVNHVETTGIDFILEVD
jgi:hypothetical protein